MNKKTIDMLRKLSVATITMQLLKKGVRMASMNGVRPLNKPTKSIVGPAFTLRFIPGREDLSSPETLAQPDYAPRVAIEKVPKGAILVIDGRGQSNLAVLGDIIIERLKFRRIGGLVTDGGIRDLEECLRADFPIYACGPAAPASITGHAGGDTQCAIGCGGVAVIPNDIIVGDGVAVIPAHLASQVAKDGFEQENFETFAKLQIKKGAPLIGTYPPDKHTKTAYEQWVHAEKKD
jgi:regulator of RNase E activity RraA